GARPKTIANYHGLLYMILAAAVRAGLRPGNPCAGTRLPDRYSPDATGDRDAVFLTETQFALVARAMFPTSDCPVAGRGRPGRRPRSAAGKHAGTVEDRWLVEAAVGTGLRWSELTALQVQDLELDAPVARLSVKRAWKRNPLGEFTVLGAGAFYLGKPKSRKSRRRITLSPTVVTVLRRAMKGKAPDDLVFTAPQGGALNQATWYEDRWQVALALAAERGLTAAPRFHDLRHTHAAWLISAGAPRPRTQDALSVSRLYGLSRASNVPRPHARPDSGPGRVPVPSRLHLPREDSRKTTPEAPLAGSNCRQSRPWGTQSRQTTPGKRDDLTLQLRARSRMPGRSRPHLRAPRRTGRTECSRSGSAAPPSGGPRVARCHPLPAREHPR
ncbi:MAG: hypothetical protein JWM15_1065, partial [Cryptosporangiaceae bacterium]|nr:hypothetical protein [Cryptosporangiaceae bacterium]